MTNEAESSQLEQVLREATAAPSVISFAGGFPAVETFPRTELVAAAQSVLSEEGIATSLQYTWPEGEPGLREWVVARLGLRGIEASPEDVIITSGAQQALSLATEALVSADSRVLVDRYCYGGALELFRARSAQLTTRIADATCAYQMPGVANPFGDGSVERQLGPLLAQGCPIIADEAYGELRFDGAPPAPLGKLAKGRVYTVGSVSKTLCPGLRIGWLVTPPGKAAPLCEDKRLDDLQASTLCQSLLMHFLRHHDYDAHVRRSARLYRARAHCMVSALGTQLPAWRISVPEGGFSVIAETGRAIAELDMLEAARRAGVVYDPGASFRVEPSDQLVLRLCYSNLSTELIRQGVGRLRRAWEDVSGAA